MNIVAVWLWLVLVSTHKVSCESSDTTIYSVVLFEHSVYFYPIVEQWTFERNIWNEVLFFWPDVDENQESDGSLMTVSSKRLSDSEFHSSFNAWKTMRQDFDYVRLSCAPTENRASVCICTKYIRSEESNVSSIPAEASNSSDWIRSSMSECNSIPPLTAQVFRDFRKLTLLEFDMVQLDLVQADAFRDLDSLEYFRISNYSMAAGAVMNGTLCGLETLFVVQIYGKGYNNESNDFLPFLRCGTSDNESAEVSTHNNYASIVDIKNTSLSLIQKDTFASFTSNELFVLFLQYNMITDIEDEAFVAFPQLCLLDISENQLIFLRPSVFKGLTGLFELNLAFNRLEVINVSVFENLSSLISLDLTGNLILHLEGRFSLLKQLVFLEFESNRLNSVNATTFSNSVELRELRLRFNQISTISSNAFIGCPNLWHIDLTGNLLDNSTNIKEFLQFKIKNLAILGLAQNKILSVLPLMFSQNPDRYPFQVLTMDSSQIKALDKDAFTGITALLLLSLMNNSLTYLHPDTFKTNRRLHTVYLDDNCLESIPPMPESLENLYSASNCVRRLPLFNKTMANLKLLIISGNPLGSLDENSFYEFPSLVGLNVSRCNLSYISKDTFYNNQRLKCVDLSQNYLNINFSVDYWRTSLTLTYVNLSHNSIPSAKNLFLHSIRNAITVDLSHNPLVVFPDQTNQGSTDQPIIYTERLLLKNCSLVKVSESALEMAINIMLVDLSSNNLTQFKPFKLHDQGRKVTYKVVLDDNPILCSCEMSWLKDAEYRLHYIVPFCIRVTTGTVQKFSSVAREDFLCRVTELCTVELFECECYTEDLHKAPTLLNCSFKLYPTFPKNLEPSFKFIYFEGNSLTAFKTEFISITLTALEILVLRQNEIVEVEPFSFEKFPNLLILDLSENRIVNIHKDTFTNLRRIKYLYLNNNLITAIDGLAFGDLRLLNILTLHNNSLELLTTDNLADIESLVYLNSLTLYNNPWSCPCDNASFKHWIQQRLEIISNFSKILCNNISIVNIPNDKLLCKSIFDIQYFIECLIFFSISCILLVVKLLLVYRFRYVLQVLLYSTFGLRQKRKENQMCCYDAFTIYDNSDVFVRQWIQNVFLFRLEPKFDLFIPERDMLAGTDKNNELIKRVKLCHRTIVVISKAAMQVQEVSFIFEVAYHHMTLEHSDHDLLLILLDGVTCKKLLTDNELDANLKPYLKTDKCLSVSDKLFWQKLNFFLPKPFPPNQGDVDLPVQKSSYTISL